MHLVLDLSKKLFGRFRRSVVVEGCGVDVRDFLIKLPLRQPDLPDFLQLFLKIFLR